jgi:hypothetical protein
MTAWFKCYEYIRATRQWPGLRQCNNFCVRFSGSLMKTFSNDFTVFDNDAAHAWVRLGRITPSLRQFKRARHVKLIRLSF